MQAPIASVKHSADGILFYRVVHEIQNPPQHLFAQRVCSEKFVCDFLQTELARRPPFLYDDLLRSETCKELRIPEGSTHVLVVVVAQANEVKSSYTALRLIELPFANKCSVPDTDISKV